MLVVFLLLMLAGMSATFYGGYAAGRRYMEKLYIGLTNPGSSRSIRKPYFGLAALCYALGFWLASGFIIYVVIGPRGTVNNLISCLVLEPPYLTDICSSAGLACMVACDLWCRYTVWKGRRSTHTTNHN